MAGYKYIFRIRQESFPSQHRLILACAVPPTLVLKASIVILKSFIMHKMVWMVIYCSIYREYWSLKSKFMYENKLISLFLMCPLVAILKITFPLRGLQGIEWGS